MRRTIKDISAAMESRNIPSELEQFLQRDAFSLAIKGKAGTGKTTLALTILSLAMKNQTCLYISTRLATSELFQFHPWIQQFLEDSRSQENQGLELVDTAPFVDARLDEPSTLFERITNELMDTNSPLIIIDTWDAVGDFMDREALVTNAKILQIWRQRSRAKLVFVIENVENETFDSLVDGVIQLEEEYIDSRKTRRIHLSKLRGVKIERPWNFFTLDQGIFHSFEPYNPVEQKDLTSVIPRRVVPKATLSEGTSGKIEGFALLDKLLSGLIPNDSLVIVEPDPVVNPKAALTFVVCVVAGHVKKRNTVVILPPTSIPGDYANGLLKKWIPDSVERQRVELVQSQSTQTGKDSRSTQVTDHIKKSIDKVKQENPDSKLLGVLSIDPIVTENGLDLKSLEAMIASFDSSLLINYMDPKKSERLSGIADVRLKIRDMEGTLFVHPERPWASFYAIENDKRNGGIVVQPMV